MVTAVEHGFGPVNPLPGYIAHDTEHFARDITFEPCATPVDFRLAPDSATVYSLLYPAPPEPLSKVRRLAPPMRRPQRSWAGRFCRGCLPTVLRDLVGTAVAITAAV